VSIVRELERFEREMALMNEEMNWLLDVLYECESRILNSRSNNSRYRFSHQPLARGSFPNMVECVTSIRASEKCQDPGLCHESLQSIKLVSPPSVVP